MAIFLHGFYDATAMIQKPFATLLYYAFVIIMYIWIFRLIRKQSQTDEPV